jgi:hypothetical protein
LKKAVYRVACLEWEWWIKDQIFLQAYGADILLLFETTAAKEARKHKDCLGNPLDCSIGKALEIEMRTKWQSGLVYGDIAKSVLMGNHRIGDEPAMLWEILPDQSRKINLMLCHPI